MTDWQWQLFPWSNQWLDLIHELQKKKKKMSWSVSAPSINSNTPKSQISREISLFRMQKGLSGSAVWCVFAPVCERVQMLGRVGGAFDYETPEEQPWCLCG